MDGLSVIIPAAGKGTRVKGISRGMSKVMLPLNGKPLISHIIDQVRHVVELSNYKAYEIILVYSEEDVVEFCKWFKDDIYFVEQKNQYGLLHAVTRAFDHASYDDCLIWLGDTLVDGTNVLDSIGINLGLESFTVVSPVDDYERWCMYDGKKFYDKWYKPPPTNNAVVGIYHIRKWKNYHRQARNLSIDYLRTGHESEISLLLEHVDDMQAFYIPTWIDCGTITSYNTARKYFLEQHGGRSFNHFKLHQNYPIVTKTSNVSLEPEFKYLVDIELTDVASLFPRVYDVDHDDKMSYSMEWYPYPTLDEILLTYNLTNDTKVNVFKKLLTIIGDLHGLTSDYDTTESNLQDFYFELRINRLAQFSYYEYVDEIIAFIKETRKKYSGNIPFHSGVVHGDLNLSNVLYDLSSGIVKFIDVRGTFPMYIGIGGDIYYDYMKLMQDIYCGYYMINNYNVFKKEIHEHLCGILLPIMIDHLGSEIYKYVRDMSVIIMASCIPFHLENQEKVKLILERSYSLIKMIQNEQV